MGIENVSVDYAQAKLLSEVSAAVLALSLQEVRGNAARMQGLLESADRLERPIGDPALGSRFDALA